MKQRGADVARSSGATPTASGYDTGYETMDGGSLFDDYDSLDDVVGLSEGGPDDGAAPDDARRRAAQPGGGRARRGAADRQARARRRRSRRVVAVSVVIFAVIVAVAAWLIVVPIYRYLHPADYSGAGSGRTVVTVHTDDGATQIGQRLHDAGVVASVRAFTDVASDNSASQNIQPGSYRMHRHMSAKAALGLLLDPATKIDSNLLVPEGATTQQIVQRLSAPVCTGSATSTTICGAGLPKAQVDKALRNVRALGLPSDYTAATGRPVSSAEGFLFPATYPLPDKITATDALQQMIANFAEQARTINFTAAARAQHISPYQELIIASIAQGEAKYATDYPKVARVILNRLATHKPLQIDATSAYAAKLAGLDPAKVIYAKIKSPYNTYTHPGLPPTPIGNPGAEAMRGVAKPVAGNWLYYVNSDAAGHLFFTNSETAFAKAAARCKAEHWGCG